MWCDRNEYLLDKDSNQILYSVEYTPTQIHALNTAEATVLYLDR
jgi:hypothetical protein